MGTKSWQTLIALGLLPVGSGCVSPMSGGAPATAPMTPPTSAQAGGQTIIAIAPPAAPAPAPPPNVFDFLGVPQIAKGIGALCQHDLQKLQMLFPAQFAAYPGLEAKPPILPLNDPANLQSDNPAIKAAAEVKKDEDIQLQKIKAIKYLAGLGCRGCYPEVEKAILAGLDDCTEEVRFQVVSGLRDAAGAPCKFCKSTSCCSPTVRRRLAEVSEGVDEEGCYLEPSARVRRMARVVLDQCGIPQPPRLANEGPKDDLLTPASELDQKKKPNIPTSIEDPLSVPEGESIPLNTGDETASVRSDGAAQVDSSVRTSPADTISQHVESVATDWKKRTPTVRDLKSKVAARSSRQADSRTGDTRNTSQPTDSRILASVDGVQIYRSEIELLLNDWAKRGSSGSSMDQRRELQEFVNMEIERLIEVKKRNASNSRVASSKSPIRDSKIAKASYQSPQQQLLLPEPEPIRTETQSRLPEVPLPVPAPRSTAEKQQRHLNVPHVVESREVPNEVFESASVLIYGEPIEVTDEALIDYFEKHRQCYLQRSEVRWEQVSADYRDFLSHDQACKSLAKLRHQIVNSGDDGQALPEGDEYAIAPDAVGNPRKVPLNLKKLKVERFGWTEISHVQDLEIARALCEMPVGNLSPIIEERGRFRVVRVLEVRNRRPPMFEEVKDKVRDDYIQARANEINNSTNSQPQYREWTLFAGDEYILENVPGGDAPVSPRRRHTTVFDGELVPEGAQSFEHPPSGNSEPKHERTTEKSRELYDSVKDRLEIHFGDRWHNPSRVEPRNSREQPLILPELPADRVSPEGRSTE